MTYTLGFATAIYYFVKRQEINDTKEKANVTLNNIRNLNMQQWQYQQYQYQQQQQQEQPHQHNLPQEAIEMETGDRIA